MQYVQQNVRRVLLSIIVRVARLDISRSLMMDASKLANVSHAKLLAIVRSVEALQVSVLFVRMVISFWELFVFLNGELLLIWNYK